MQQFINDLNRNVLEVLKISHLKSAKILLLALKSFSHNIGSEERSKGQCLQ